MGEANCAIHACKPPMCHAGALWLLLLLQAPATPEAESTTTAEGLSAEDTSVSA